MPATAHIRTVRIERITDDNPDLSHLGRYSHQVAPGAIDRKARGDMTSREVQYFIAANVDYAEQDYERMEAYNRGDWTMIGIVAKAEVVIRGVCQTLHSGGLWGVESDSEPEYFASVEQEELAALEGIMADCGCERQAITRALDSMAHAVCRG